MALLVKQGTFQLTSLDSGTITITGVGFTPKLVLFFSSNDDVDSLSNAFRNVMGACTATEEFVVGHYARNGATTSISRSGIYTASLLGVGNSATPEFEYSFSSFNSDGFVLTVNSAPSSNTTIGYIALGGSDLRNSKIGTFSTTTSTGSKQITGVGFQGNCLITLGTSYQIDSIARDDINPGIGFVVDASNEAGIGASDEDGLTTTSTGRRYTTSGFLVRCDAGSSGDADFTSFDSDGFTFNVSDAFEQAHISIYVMLDISKAYVGNFTVQASTGNFSVSNFGFRPQALIVASSYRSAETRANDLKFMVGISDFTDDYAIGGVTENGVTTTNAFRVQNDGYLTANYDTAKTLLGQISTVSKDNDGMTLNQDVADSTSSVVIFLALGVSSGPLVDADLVKNNLVNGKIVI